MTTTITASASTITTSRKDMTMWQEYERDAWLGQARDEMTDEQLSRFDSLAERIAERWPDDEDDMGASRSERLSGALMIVLGDATLEELGAERARAKLALEEATQRLQGAIVASADLGPSEIARRAGVARDTVRQALGRMDWSR